MTTGNGELQTEIERRRVGLEQRKAELAEREEELDSREAVLDYGELDITDVEDERDAALADVELLREQLAWLERDPEIAQRLRCARIAGELPWPPAI